MKGGRRAAWGIAAERRGSWIPVVAVLMGRLRLRVAPGPRADVETSSCSQCTHLHTHLRARTHTHTHTHTHTRTHAYIHTQVAKAAETGDRAAMATGMMQVGGVGGVGGCGLMGMSFTVRQWVTAVAINGST